MFEIDFDSDESLYMQLRNQVVRQIAGAQLREGEVLPSVRSLADTIGVNMHTVNKAYAILREEGYIRLDRRKKAVISVQTEEKELEKEKICGYLRMIVAEAVCKGISREEMKEMIDWLYDGYTGRE